MKNIAVLILAFGCCVCQVAAEENNDNLSLISISQTLGAVGEKITLLESKLLIAEREVLELRSLTADKPQVAFSATLTDTETGNIGPFTINTPLKYMKVFSNTGNGYSPSTGIFTAPVSGTYYFRFSMQVTHVPNSAVSLMKNTERLVTVWDTGKSDGTDMSSNAVVIALQTGDSVYVELHANRAVYDDHWNYNTFSGFLLFAA